MLILIDDSFNATPESAIHALEWMETTRAKGGRSIFVVGGIEDLGGLTNASHREIGVKASETVDMLVTQGEVAAIAGRAALENGMQHLNVKMTFSPDDAAHVLSESLTPDDLVLIKGGSSARMEQVTRLLLSNPEDAQRLARTESAYDSVWTNRPARPTWLEVDKAAIASNIRNFKAFVGDNVAIMAIVKANAFGHGALAASSTALLNGATYLGVASVSEAIDLREDAINAPILCLGYTPPWAIRQAVRYDLTVTLYDLDTARAFDRIAREMNGTIKAHIKLDSGMARLGLLPDQVVPFFRSLRSLKNLEVEGIYTHFSTADSDLNYAQVQFQTFVDQLNILAASGFKFKYIHAANTAATLYFPDSRLNMVRIGLGMYGLQPNKNMEHEVELRPALAWKTSIAQVKTLKPGSYVGYNNDYRTEREERIAIIPVGYADGFRRAPQHWSYVLVNGQRAPIIGRISMDMATINVSDIPDVAIGDEVVLIGQQGDEQITAGDVAEQLGTSAYEVVSTILARVPRV